jgi:hypothetical protein
MSQSISVPQQYEHKMIAEQIQSPLSEKARRVGRAGLRGPKRTDNLQDSSMDTLLMPSVEADGTCGVTKLGQVIMFLIELVDKEASN